ncbi:putative lipoprotein [Leptospira fainei serovar Hurstbridge str. BUT 6]|uniref:Lipoprotein n=1 Tax=Leptospira fainei serovar Hurstbridge str. BUT 6 TaxID=1193011 RepID=S3VZR8_9LEPT|nr:lipoprotein [Leptospira fainei]EPG73587.1 putative lipoprotein [Leptospira fainei serovar Hurstbridge str. BUT 6]
MSVVRVYILLVSFNLCFFYACIPLSNLTGGPTVTSSDATLQIDTAIIVGLSVNPNLGKLQSSFGSLAVVQGILGISASDMSTKYEKKTVDSCANMLMLYSSTTTSMDGIVGIAATCKLKKEPF